MNCAHLYFLTFSTKFKLDITAKFSTVSYSINILNMLQSPWVIIVWNTIHSSYWFINKLKVRTHPSCIVKHREFCLVLQLLRFSKLSMISMSVAKLLHKGDICCLWKPTFFIQQSQDAWRIVLQRCFIKVSDITFNKKTSLLQRKTFIKSVPVTAITKKQLEAVG